MGDTISTISELLPGTLGPILNSQTTDELLGVLNDFTEKLGFSIVSYQMMPPIGFDNLGGPVAIYSKGYPDDIMSTYVTEKLYADDPLFKTAIRTGKVFWWWDVEKYHNLTPNQKKFMSVMKEANFSDGYAIPTFGPNGRNGFFGLGRGSLERSEDSKEGKLMQLFCQALHLQYCLITQHLRQISDLSNKEHQVMTHVARGLSTNEIADTLGVSANTINTHLKHVYLKFDVNDRVSATLRFLAFGYIYDR